MPAVTTLSVRGASEHNLKAIDVEIPRAGDHGRVRRVGIRQVVAGVRHDRPRGAAPLSRDVLVVRQAVPRAHGAAGGALHRRPVAGHRRRSADDHAQPAIHGRHADGPARRPAPALRPPRHGAGGSPRRAAPLLVQFAARRLPGLPGPRRRGPARPAAARRRPGQDHPAGRARHHDADRLRHLLAGDDRRPRPGVPRARLRRRHAVAGRSPTSSATSCSTGRTGFGFRTGSTRCPRASAGAASPPGPGRKASTGASSR